MKKALVHWFILFSLIVAPLGQNMAAPTNNLNSTMQNTLNDDCSTHQQPSSISCSSEQCSSTTCLYSSTHLSSIFTGHYGIQMSNAHYQFVSLNSLSYLNLNSPPLIPPPNA